MANHLQHRLPDLELPEPHAQEALRCALHSIIFAREPKAVEPVDCHCEYFPMSYSACRGSDTQAKVEAAARELLANLVPAGPELSRGFVTLQFSVKKSTTRGLFWTREDKVVWEEWVLPLLVNTSLQPAANARISADERHRLQHDQDAEYTLNFQSWMLDVFTHLNQGVDHIPPPGESSHEISIMCHQGSEREVTRGRSMSTPMPVGQL